MQKNLIKVIIFDLDETLYGERTFVKSGFLAVAEYIEKQFKINKKDFFETLIDILEKEGRGHVFDIALRKYNLYNKKLVDRLVRIYRCHKPNIRPYSGAMSLLDSFKKKKYKLALITDGLDSVQRNKVAALGIEKFFDLIIYTSKEGKNKAKPNPYSFKKVLKYFNVSPQEVICVGDNPYKDIAGAGRLGIKTIRVLKGSHKNIEPSYSVKNSHNVKKITEIIKLIN